MGTQERREREWIERENHILTVGRRMLLDRGYAGLTMDRIAEEIEYSKGIVYKHFSSKEDLVCGVTLDALRGMIEMLRHAIALPGTSRERIVAAIATSQVHFRRNPEHFEAVQMSRISSIISKASPTRLSELDTLNQELLRFFLDILDEAIARGELPLPAEEARESLVYGIWCLMAGAQNLQLHSHIIGVFKDVDRERAQRRNLHAMLDGWGWRPLSSEWNYEETAHRAIAEVFADEPHDKTLNSL